MYLKDFFSISIPQFEEYLKVFKGKPDLLFLEIGTFEGRAAVWLLENILTDDSSKIHVVDPFVYTRELKYYEGMGSSFTFNDIKENFLKNTEQYRNKINLWEELSFRVWPKILSNPSNKYDVIYVDGSHEARDVLLDAVCSWLVLKEGGILIFDDYLWGKNFPENMRPKLAIDSFLKAYQTEIKVLHKENQVYIEKIKSDRINSKYPIK